MLGREIRAFIDENVAVEGPTCGVCEEFASNRRENAVKCGEVTDLTGRKYESPHASTFRTEARMADTLCRVGRHGERVTFPY